MLNAGKKTVNVLLLAVMDIQPLLLTINIQGETLVQVILTSQSMIVYVLDVVLAIQSVQLFALNAEITYQHSNVRQLPFSAASVVVKMQEQIIFAQVVARL